MRHGGTSHASRNAVPTQGPEVLNPTTHIKVSMQMLRCCAEQNELGIKSGMSTTCVGGGSPGVRTNALAAASTVEFEAGNASMMPHRSLFPPAADSRSSLWGGESEPSRRAGCCPFWRG